MKLDFNTAHQLIVIRNHIKSLVDGTRPYMTKEQIPQLNAFVKQADIELINFACQSDLTKEAVAIKAAASVKLKEDLNPPQVGGASGMSRRVADVAAVKEKLATPVKTTPAEVAKKVVASKTDKEAEKPKAKKDKKQMIEELLAQDAQINVSLPPK